MKLNDETLQAIVNDLGIGQNYSKGQKISVRNCWHFCTDGTVIDALFTDETDFAAGMNRIFILSRKYRIVILAFVLMDTHVHFILWGDYCECNRFIHEYVRRTSMFISKRHGETHKLDGVPIRASVIGDDLYLKTAICYVVRNAPVGGIDFNAIDYPWSSGPLYFRRAGNWASPSWTFADFYDLADQVARTRKTLLRTAEYTGFEARMVGELVFPGEYVAYDVVERLFRTPKGYNYFLGRNKDEDIETSGSISHLSIPMQEMRQHKNELCERMFGEKTVKRLNTNQRLRLARALRSRYNSSPKQVARLCGLVYEEVMKLI